MIADRRSLLVSFVLGAAAVCAHAPVGWAPVSWLALAGLYLLIAGHEPRRAALLGFAFGAGYFLIGVSWVYVSMSVFGGMVAPLAALATILFCLTLALYAAAATALHRWIACDRPVFDVLLFGAAWGLVEWTRGWLLTGFPWLALGYAQVPGGGTTLHGLLPVFGVFGVSAATASLGALLAEAWRGRGARVTLLGPLFAAGGLLAGAGSMSTIAWTTPVGAPVRVALLQGNVPQELKWSPALYAESLRVYHDLMRDHPAKLTVLPETAFPSFLHQLPGDYVAALRRLAASEDGAVLAGVVVGDRERYTNSLVRLDRDAAGTEMYSKSHLVPFGEFVPPGFEWFMRQMNIPMSGFTPGAAAQAPFAIGRQRIAANICYEDLFGEELIGALPAATMLVNASNTAWFGRSLAQPQHLAIARVRAIETGRPMLRATNTGMTAAIAPDGRVIAVLEPFARGALVIDVDGRSGMTPYARLGNAGALILIVLLALPALVLRFKNR
jgi:apolipoprotein N-acyltransferase